MWIHLDFIFTNSDGNRSCFRYHFKLMASQSYWNRIPNRKRKFRFFTYWRSGSNHSISFINWSLIHHCQCCIPNSGLLKAFLRSWNSRRPLSCWDITDPYTKASFHLSKLRFSWWNFDHRYCARSWFICWYCWFNRHVHLWVCWAEVLWCYWMQDTCSRNPRNIPFYQRRIFNIWLC